MIRDKKYKKLLKMAIFFILLKKIDLDKHLAGPTLIS